MDLENIGSGGLDKLVAKIKQRYPDYNFDVPPPPDTECKQKVGCAGLNNIMSGDKEGNIYSGSTYKQTKKENIYQWAY